MFATIRDCIPMLLPSSPAVPLLSFLFWVPCKFVFLIITSGDGSFGLTCYRGIRC